jgi:hypothetical protein
MAEASGLVRALAEAAAAASLGDDAEQLEMEPMAQLPLLELRRDGKVMTSGRPKGALNKSTKELASYILSRHRHPVVAAAQICDMPLADLKQVLHCDTLDAAKYQQTCREFVARYTLQAMPQSVTVDMGTVGMLMVINQNAPRAGEDRLTSPFALDLTPIEQNQSLSEGESQSPHGHSPHADNKTSTNNELDQNGS